jgi:hypothetical protein
VGHGRFERSPRSPDRVPSTLRTLVRLSECQVSLLLLRRMVYPQGYRLFRHAPGLLLRSATYDRHST